MRLNKGTIEEQIEQAKAAIDFHREAKSRHTIRRDKHREKGDLEQAEKSQERHNRANSHMMKAIHTLKKLEGVSARREKLNGRVVLRAEPEAFPEADKKTIQTSKRMKTDPRTAAGRRAYDLVGLGTATRASLNHFATCFPKTQDRTGARVLAWAEFDVHCYKAYGGLIPPSKFEPGVDTSRVPEIANSRLDAVRRDADLRRELGTTLHSLLLEVIHHQKTFKELATNLSDEDVARLFYTGLDMLAEMWRIQSDNARRTEPGRRARASLP